jgi:hypothetical protein
VNEQFALAGRILATGINDDGIHGRVDDMLSADRAIERVVVELEFDAAQGTKSYPKSLTFARRLTG